MVIGRTHCHSSSKNNDGKLNPVIPYDQGIDETMSIDNCKHSLFGASKVAADILV